MVKYKLLKKGRKKKIFWIIGILLAFIIGIILFIYFQKEKTSLFVDLRRGEWCGQTASGYGTCGYTGPIKDCDCEGEKYTWWNGVTDIGLVIKCDGNASNFRDIPFPKDICKDDLKKRCQLLGGEACNES